MRALRYYGALNKDMSVHSIYTDLTRLFDAVNIDLLRRKLEGCGINGSLLKWVCSYLNGRKQRVKIKEFISELIAVLSGAGQGTHLGPVLFPMYNSFL